MTATDWEALVDGAFDDVAARLAEVSVEEKSVDGERVGVVSLRFGAEDLRGVAYEAAARLFLPEALVDGSLTRAPVWFNCGYELPVDIAVQHVRQGRVVATALDPQDEDVFPFHNPLCRGPNTDFVLAHLVRGLRFVDVASIVYAGGSAGGYAALLVAAEAFPATAAAVKVPVVNLAYQGAYLMANGPRLAAEPPAEQPLQGALMSMFLPFIDGWRRGYGGDVSAPGWYEHSPVAHLDRISCPVTVCFSTADFLVPIEQVGQEVATATLAALPPGVTMAAGELTPFPGAAVRLLDVLGERADVRLVAPPENAPLMQLDALDLTMSRPQVDMPTAAAPDDGRQWLVTVVDEGPTVFGIGHTRHAFEPDFEPFVQRALSSGIGANQLTSAKLDQLLRRWAGVEWLASGFHHLDRPVAERRDVERGLRAYCAASPQHVSRFRELYSALPTERQVLPQALVAELLSS